MPNPSRARPAAGTDRRRVAKGAPTPACDAAGIVPSFDDLLARAVKLFDAGDTAESNRCALEALDIAVARHSSEMQAKAHAHLAQCALARRDIAAAGAHAQTALERAHEFGDDGLRASCHLTVARLSFDVSDYGQALIDLEAARPWVTGSGQDRMLFRFHTFLGNIQLMLDQLDAAIESGDLSLAIAARLQDPRSQAIATGNLAGRWFEQGKRWIAEGAAGRGEQAIRHALELSESSIALADAACAARLNLSHFSNHASMLVALDRDDDALAMFERHRRLAARLDEQGTLSSALEGEARMARRRGDLARARVLLRDAVDLAERLQLTSDLPQLYETASSLEAESGDFREALRLHHLMHRAKMKMLSASAEERSRLMAVRLATERAVREAAAERERADELRHANLELQRRAENLGREAVEDSLTGLTNRRGLDAHLMQRHAEARARHASACVAMIDIDRFKRVNDRFSHAVGDLVLQRVGSLLRQYCREGDVAARAGGEEFVLSFKSIDLRQAAEVCERLRQAVQRAPWGDIADGLEVTVSMGLADMAKSPTVGDGLAAADALLYEAKHAGRNRVSVRLHKRMRR